MALLFACYMLFDPAEWLSKFMQLTPMSLDFCFFILSLGIAFLCFSSAGESVIFPWISRKLGLLVQKSRKTPKERKTYKKVQEQLRI